MANRFVIILLLILNLSIFSSYSPNNWSVKLNLLVDAQFSNENEGIDLNMKFSFDINGTMVLDQGDYTFYIDKTGYRSFQGDIYDLKNKKLSVIEGELKPKFSVDYVIRDKTSVYFEFTADSKLEKLFYREWGIKARFPMSFGILNRKKNRRYRSGIVKGSNRIRILEKKLYDLTPPPLLVFSWLWKQSEGDWEQKHNVIVNVNIEQFGKTK